MAGYTFQMTERTNPRKAFHNYYMAGSGAWLIALPMFFTIRYHDSYLNSAKNKGLAAGLAVGTVFYGLTIGLALVVGSFAAIFVGLNIIHLLIVGIFFSDKAMSKREEKHARTGKVSHRKIKKIFGDIDPELLKDIDWSNESYDPTAIRYDPPLPTEDETNK